MSGNTQTPLYNTHLHPPLPPLPKLIHKTNAQCHAASNNTGAYNASYGCTRIIHFRTWKYKNYLSSFSGSTESWAGPGNEDKNYSPVSFDLNLATPQILSCSCGEESIFVKACEIESGNGLGTRLLYSCATSCNVNNIIFFSIRCW